MKKLTLKSSMQTSQYPLSLEPENLQLEQTMFPMFSLYFSNISKFPVTGSFFGPFSPFSVYPDFIFVTHLGGLVLVEDGEDDSDEALVHHLVHGLRLDV